MNFLMDAAPKMVFAFWLGIVVVILTVLMLSIILIMRQVMLRRERNHQRAVVTWQQTLSAADSGTLHGEPPPLPARDVSGFLEVWNNLHATHSDGIAPELLAVANSVGLERHLFRVLQHGGFHNLVVGIIALGNLRNPAHFGRVACFLDDKSPLVSLCAARALMQMDQANAVSMFVPQIVRRGDWSQGNIAAILHETSTPQMARELSRATLQANAEVAPRLVRFLAAVSPDEAAPVIRTILASDAEADDHLVSTCLQVMTDPDDLSCVRPLLQHPRWHVRMQAAATLGRLGVPGDDDLLVDMLSDEQWWVRYRTAQGLMKLPFVGASKVRSIRNDHADHFARDILDHVLAERTLEGAHG
ncbi:MAG: HEAT repeat domain-containing protein [Pseudomonadota bacterium]|nr:HEAT repeat domain-containing protein [Pseudomonadota bacterium]